MNQDFARPLIIIILGVLTWIGGNLLGDRQGGTNLALTLIGIGGGLAKQDSKPAAVSGKNIENITVEGNEGNEGNEDKQR